MFRVLAPSINFKAVGLYLLTLMFAGMALGLYVQSARLKASEVSVQTLTAERDRAVEAQNRAAERLSQTRKVLVAREAKIASQARKITEAQDALQNALQAEKAWSDTDVPTPVQKALLGRSDGSGAGLDSPARVRQQADRP